MKRRDLVQKTWVGAMVILGVVYAFVGILFAMPASHVKVWRLAAWVVSAP